MIKKLFNHKNFKGSHKSIINVSLSGLMITSLLFATYISLNNESYKTDISTNKPVPLATEISDNEATGNGGGINNQGSIIMKDGKISENNANNGGGIHNSGDITLLDGEISNNEATTDGGGIYNTNDATVSTEEPMLITGVELNALIPDTVTLVVFSDDKAPSGVELTDVSAAQNESIMSWVTDDDTMYISTQRKGLKVYANTDSSKMFYNQRQLENIDFNMFDTSEVENMSYMLASNNPSYPMNLTSVDVSNFNVSKVSDMSHMFQLCDKVTELDVSNWNTENLIDTTSLFYCCSSLETLDVSNWDTSNINLMTTMFAGYGNSSTNIYYFMNLKELDVSNWITKEVTSMKAMFNYCTELESLDLSNWNTYNVKNTASMFQRCHKLEYIDVSNWDTANVQDMSYMFNKCYVLDNLDLSNWNTSNVNTTESMFQECHELNYIDVTNFVTQNNKDISHMFHNCYKINGLDVSQWDTQNVKDMYATFANCKVLDSIDVSNWVTASVEDAGALFYNCQVVEYLDVADWNVDKSKSFEQMFQGCYKLNNLDTNKWTTASAENLGNMFCVTPALTSINVSNFNTSNVSNFACMFETSGLTSIDISNLNTSNGKHFNQMFNNTPLEEISGLENFNTTNAVSMFRMFSNNNSLKELDLSSFNTRNVESGTITHSDGTTGISEFLYNNNKLERVTIGNDFSFVSKDGNSSFVLPTPSSEFIDGADGHWYNEETFEQFEPSEIPSFVEATYVAVNPNPIVAIEASVVDGYESIGILNKLNNDMVIVTATYKDGSKGILSSDDFTLDKSNAPDTEGDFKLNIKLNSNMSTEKVSDTSVEIEATLPMLITGFEFNKLIPVNTRQVVFTSDVAPDTVTPIDVSLAQNNSVIAWQEDTVYKVSTQIDGLKVVANPDSTVMFYSANTSSGRTHYLTSIDSSNLDTSKIVYMDRMFEYMGCKSGVNLDLSNWNTSNVESMYGLFSGTAYNSTSKFSIDLSSWDVSNVTDISDLFSNAGYNAKIFSANLSGWDISNVTSISNLFFQAGKNATTCTITGINNWNTSNVLDMSGCFNNTGFSARSFDIDLTTWDTSKVTNMRAMFMQTGNSVSNPYTFNLGDLSIWNTSNVENMTNMFYGTGKPSWSLDCSGKEVVLADGTKYMSWDVSKVTEHNVFKSSINVIEPNWVN